MTGRPLSVTRAASSLISMDFPMPRSPMTTIKRGRRPGRAETIEVRCQRRGFAAHQLRRRIPGSATVSLTFTLEHRRQAEIEQPDAGRPGPRSGARDHHEVRWLEVTVDDRERVKGFESVRDLG